MLQEWVDAHLISPTQADAILGYEQAQMNATPHTGTQRLLIAFSIIGALLVGLGIILLLAHNWDEFSRSTKLMIAITPLIISQGLALFTLQQKPHSAPWQESSATLVCLTLGSALAIVSQTYHLGGHLGDLLSVWMVLALPLMYLLRSQMAAILSLIGITAMGALIAYDENRNAEQWRYWLLLAAWLPYYYQQLKNATHSWGTAVFNWLLAISLAIMSVSTIDLLWQHPPKTGTVYVLIALYFYAVSRTPMLDSMRPMRTGFRPLAVLTFLIISFVYTLEEAWLVYSQEVDIYNSLPLLLSLPAWGYLMYRSYTQKSPTLYLPSLVLPAAFLLAHALSLQAEGFIISNLAIIIYGVWMIIKGAQNYAIGKLNLGMLSLAGLITLRFFDEDIPFVIKGITFIMIGIAFFVANLWLIKRQSARKEAV